ncbi:MAG: hypothetical protein H0V80_07675 [Acidobacteria bacterium]|nr:hypothetical protein [Acidobacteriota bacterium]
MVKRRTVLSAVLAALLSSTTVVAHHGWSSYLDKPMTLDGVITASTYGNPHGTVKLEVKGKVWDVVLAPTPRMQSRGLTEPMLAKGTTARVVGYQHREVATEMRAERITIGDKTVELR